MFFFLFALISASTLSLEDMVSMARVEHPAVSSSGLLAFTQTEFVNGSVVASLMVKDEHSAQIVSLQSPSQPVWLSGSILAFINGQDNGQIWVAHVSGGLSGGPITTHALTSFQSSVHTFKFEPETSTLVFTLEVYQDGSLDTVQSHRLNEKAAGSSGTVYDSLMVRHWDTYLNPATREQLFAVTLKIDDTVSLISTPKNLLIGTSLETPVPPFGDSNGYSVSSTHVAFSARVPEPSAAWNTNLDIYLVPLDGSSKPVSFTARNRGADTFPVFSKNGQIVVWLQMQTPQLESDHNRLMVYNLTSGRTTQIAKKWDVSPESIVFLDTENVLVTAQVRGHLGLYQVNLNTYKVTPRIEKGTVKNVCVHETSVFYLYESQLSPAEVYSASIQDEETEWTGSRFTFVTLDRMADIQLSVPEEFSFRGGLHEIIHGWIIKPVGYDESKTYPMALLIHGGPEGAWNDDWSYRWNPQMWAANGYYVVTINPHGSTGYGLEFKKGVLGQWGGTPYKDLMKGVDHVLATIPQIDEDRLCACGASYGGYMINWINGHTNRFKCLVNHDGMFDTRSTYFSTEELWFPESEFLGPAFTNDRAFDVYTKWSPSTFAHKWNTPTLIVHGELDYRLSVTEGLSTFTALQRRGIRSRLLYFPDENHWVLKRQNWIQWQSEILKWLDEFVGPSESLPEQSHFVIQSSDTLIQ